MPSASCDGVLSRSVSQVGIASAARRANSRFVTAWIYRLPATKLSTQGRGRGCQSTAGVQTYDRVEEALCIRKFVRLRIDRVDSPRQPRPPDSLPIVGRLDPGRSFTPWSSVGWLGCQSTMEISGVMVTLRARELPTGEVATDCSHICWRVASSASAWT